MKALSRVGEFFFPTGKNLGNGSWTSGKSRWIVAGLALAALFALFFVFGSGPFVPVWLYLACLGYCFWTGRACFSWARTFERVVEEARREKLRAFDPPHEDEKDKPDSG